MTKGPVLEAYAMGVKEHGEEFMRKRFEESAVRLLKEYFQGRSVSKIHTSMLKKQKALSEVLSS